jgi:putative oxidoreductase
MKRLLSTHPFSTDMAAFLLRLILGGLFVYHGYDALVHYHSYLAMSKSIIGLGTKLEFNLVVFVEFFCGIFIAFGFLTRLSVIPIFIAMAVAYFIAHAKDPFMMKELAFTFLLLSTVVFILGSGKFSVDRLLFKNKA